VDVHAHLEDITDLEGAIRRAAEAGVVVVIAVSVDASSSKFALDISQRQDYALKIYPVIGLHPWNLDLKEVEPTLEFVESTVDQAVGIGEVGLDYWYKEIRKDDEKKRFQQEVFGAFLKIAKRHAKPVIIHSRGAWEDAVDMAIETGVRKAIFHWFTGPSGTLIKLLEQGFLVSATPAVEYSKEHRRVIVNTPLESLLLETDSPVNYRGLESEPAHVARSLLAVAALKGLSENTVAEKTTQNASRIFGIEP